MQKSHIIRHKISHSQSIPFLKRVPHRPISTVDFPLKHALTPCVLDSVRMQDIRRRLSVSLPVFRESPTTPPTDTPPERRRSVYLLSNPLTPDPLSDDE